MKTPENRLSHLDLDIDFSQWVQLEALSERTLPYGLMLVSLGLDCNIKLRDINDLISRLHTRGLKTLTIELPLFMSSLLTAMEEGSDRFKVAGFAQKGQFPILFNNFSEQLLNRPNDFDSIRSFQDIYQFTSFFKKMEMDEGITEEATNEAIARYISNEEKVLDEISSDPLLSLANLYAKHIFDGFEIDEIRGFHGPGSVSDVKFADKFRTIPALPDPFSTVCGFADHDHFVSSLGMLGARSHKDFFVQSTPSEFLVVPKDARGPRTICREPLARQMYQQGIRRFMERKIEQSPLTRDFINFTDQSVNGRLALEGSLSHDYATIDLKDASDMLSFALARSIFQGVTLWDAMVDARSTSVAFKQSDIPDIKIKKFAPMGSAICFTTLSFTCWVLCKSFLDAVDKDAEVYVFGDDLIVPTKYALACMAVLENYGLIINRSKSFYRSNFRESCGTDAYKGHIVTPIKLRRELSMRNLSSHANSEIASLAATVHHLWGAGRYRSASTLENMFSFELPPGKVDSGYICVPESLRGENLEGFVARKRCGYIKVTESGRRLVRFTTLVTKTKLVATNESIINFFHRGLMPSVGARDEDPWFTPGIANEFQTSNQYGRMVLHGQTTITRSRVRVIL